MTPDVPTGYPVLSGETLVVPILGDPIAQVKSPDGVTRALVARGRDAVVVPMHVLPDDLDTVVRGLGPVRSIAGLIATVPHKFGVTAHCATLTDRAAFLGSVNVARRNSDGTWHGDQVTARRSSRPVDATAPCPRARGRCRWAPGERVRRSSSSVEDGPLSLTCTTSSARSRWPPRPALPPREQRATATSATPPGVRARRAACRVDRLKPDTFVGDVITKPAVSPLIAAARAAGCPTSTRGDLFAAVSGLIVDVLVEDGPLS